MLLVSIFLLCAASSFAKDFGKDSVDNEKCKSNPYKIPNIRKRNMVCCEIINKNATQ